MWLVIIAWITPVFACTYWLEQDDKRMYKAYMEDCMQQKTKTEYQCAKEFRQLYYETFGR